MEFYFAMGVVLMKEGKYRDAEVQFAKSYSFCQLYKNERLKLDNLILLSEICIEENRLNEAENYLHESEKAISEGSPYNMELIKVYRQLVSLYNKLHDFKRMSFYQSKYIQLKDSVYNEDMTNNLVKIHTDYIEKENQIRIESKNKILSLNEQIIRQQKIENALIGGVALLLIVLTLILVKNNLRKRKINDLLDRKVKDRTEELEMSRDALQRAWLERDILIKKASTDIQSSIATMRGLSSLGEIEIDHPKASAYWKELERTSKRLASVLHKMHNHHSK